MFRMFLLLLFYSSRALSEPSIVPTIDGIKWTGYLGIGDPRKISYARIKTYPGETLDAFNWQDVPSVMQEPTDQGQCGSCWAFAVTGALESAEVIQGKRELLDLSEQHMVSCDTESYGCSGGYMSSADFVVRKGLTDESSFRYTGRDSRCKGGLKIKAKATKYFLIGSEKRKPTIDEIKTAIVKYGPVFATVYAGGDGWSGATGKVTSCRSRGITNHMVLIVGYDKAGWVIKNSWGRNWGEGGFSHIGYNCDKIAEEAGFIVVEGEK